MDAVKEFNSELCSLYEIQPPVTKAKMSQITKTAIKALKFYKHVVQSVEKFIQKCRQEYKVPGLYIIDSIIRCSRKQFGPDKDMFAPRFSKNIVITFHSLFDCPSEDISKMIRVLNLWQKNGVYHPGIIQPLLDLASDPHNPAVFETVQKQVEQVTGLTPSMPLKCDQKPPALTADALQLGAGLDPKSDMQGDFSKVLNQLMQSMVPNPAPPPPLGLNPQVQLQLLQQILQLPIPMAPLLPNNMRLASSSSATVDSSLIGQIQMLTQQLLSQTAPVSSNQFGANAPVNDDLTRHRDRPDSEHFDDVDEPGEPGTMSSLDKRIMFMCQDGDVRDNPENSHKWHGDRDRARKHEHLKKSREDESARDTPEAGYASDVAVHHCTPATPEHNSSRRSSLRRSSDCNNEEDAEEYRRTPSSEPAEEDEEIPNGSEVENDSGSRCSEVEARASRRSKSSVRNRKRNDSSSGERKSKKSRKREEADDDSDADDHKGRKSKHKSRSPRRSPALPRDEYDDRRVGRQKRSRENHEPHAREERKSRVDSRRSEDVTEKSEGNRVRDASRGFRSPDTKRKRAEFTVEYGICDDDDDDDVIFVDMQKKSVDVSRFLEKRLPTFITKRKRGSRSSSRSSSVELIDQDPNESRKNGKDREFMPPLKPNMLSVCSTTLWIGHLNKLTTEEELKGELKEFGETTIILVPPRGCAFINFASRAEAHKALDHLKTVVIQGSQLKVAWAAGVGIKNSPFYEGHDSDLGVTYIPWSQLSSIELPPLLEGSFVDEDSLPPNFERENLTMTKSKKRKAQQRQEHEMDTEMTVINPSLIPLPQAVPLPPPPLPPISCSSVPHDSSSNPVAQIVRPPLPPSTLLPGAASSSASVAAPMAALKCLPHFDPSVPPPCFRNNFQHAGNEGVPAVSAPQPMGFRPPANIPVLETSFKNVEFPNSEASRTNGVSGLPVLINNQPVVSTASGILNLNVQEPKNPLDISTPTHPISAAGVLHPSANQVFSQIKFLTQNAGFVMQGTPENQLTMPGCVLQTQGLSHNNNNNFEQSIMNIAHMVASGLNKEQINLSIGQGPSDSRETGTHALNVTPASNLRHNFFQPPPSAQMTNFAGQDSSKRLPVPSEFLRRLGVSTSNAQTQGASTNATGNSLNKQVPLLPMPSVNVPPPGLQVPPMSPAGSQPRDEVTPSPTLQAGEPQPQDSKMTRKQPLLETPSSSKNSHFTLSMQHPSQILNLNHPAYNNLELPKKDPGEGMPTLRIPNAAADRFRTPRPPKIGPPVGENRPSLPPIVLNFQNMPLPSNPSEALISEAIKTLSPLVRIPTPQECMGFLRSPLINPANFLGAPNILGQARMDLGMHLRNPGMRGPLNFKVGDRRNVVRPMGLNHQRPMRHWPPPN